MANKDFINILQEIRGTGAPGTPFTNGLWYELTMADINGNPGIYGDILAKYGICVNHAESIEAIKTEIIAVANNEANINAVKANEANIATIVSIQAMLTSIYNDAGKLTSLFNDKAKLDSLYVDKITLDTLFGMRTILESLFADKIVLASLYADKTKLNALYDIIISMQALYANIGIMTVNAENIADIQSAFQNATDALDAKNQTLLYRNQAEGFKNEAQAIAGGKVVASNVQFSDLLSLEAWRTNTATAISTINTLLSSNDTSLDQIQELVDFIKANKATLDTLSITNIAGLETALSAKSTEIATHANNVANPHSVTKTQVGLSNVDNTSDALKPLSDAAVTALGLKADKTTTYTKTETDTLVASVTTTIEKTTSPMIGLLYNSTDDTYKRIGKNINTLTIDGFNEFTAWRSPTAERQNDNDTVSASPLTAWLDTSANLPFSFMKRYVVSNLGAEVKAYDANSYAHADQTGVTATQQVMVKIPKFNYIQAKIVDGGKTYYLYAIATASFTLNALTELGFISPTITVWNPTAGVSSGTVASNVLTSALHPAFTDNASNVMNQRYYGAFNAVSGRSICGSTIKPTGTVTLAQCRTACQGFGTGFTQLDFFLESAKNILALIERGSHYFERGGTSLANKWEGYSWNTGAGSYDQDNGLTLPLLNKTGVILNGSNRTIANSYRGIENYHSGLWRWVDGVSLSANLVYLAKPKATFSDGTITTPYFSSGYTVPSGANASYIQDFGAGSFIPTALGGSASTKVTDAAWTGSTALSVGGTLAYPSASGLATWSSDNAASAAFWSIVARSGL